MGFTYDGIHKNTKKQSNDLDKEPLQINSTEISYNTQLCISNNKVEDFNIDSDNYSIFGQVVFGD